MYQVLFQINIKKTLKKVPRADQRKIMDAITNLAIDPRPRWAEKLTGREGYRISVGNYRIIYTIEDKKLIIYIIDVDHRKDVYKS